MTSAPSPPRYKRAVVVWLAIYPSVLVALIVLNPLIDELPLPLQTLVVTAVVVPLAVYVLIPLLDRTLHRWLRPSRRGAD